MIEKKSLPSSEIRMVQLKEAYGLRLKMLLDKHPKIKEELTRKYHGTDSSDGLTVQEIIYEYLLDPELSFDQVLNSPFIQAFLEEVDDEEFLAEQEQLRRLKSETQNLGEAAEMRAWVFALIQENVEIFDGGFRALIYKFGKIPHLGEVAQRKKLDAHQRKWQRENPDRLKEIVTKANQARVAKAEPVIYTPEMLWLIQWCFDQGMSYAVAANYLNEYLNLPEEDQFLDHNLKSALAYYGLRYSPEDFREIERQEFLSEVEKVYRETGSRQAVVDHFDGRYNKKKIDHAIEKLNLRVNVNWDQTFMIGESTFSLNELLQFFLESLAENEAATNQEKSLLFVQYLAQFDIHIPITPRSFEGRMYKLKKRE
jgi:hypothetical protein